MALASEEITFKVTLDARAAKAEIKDLGDKATASIQHFSPFLEGNSAQVRNWRKEVGAAKETIEKHAGAVAALTLAFGQQEGAMGRVVRSVGGLAAAFGAGGPIGVALAGAGLAFELISSHMKDAAEGARVFGDSIDAHIVALNQKHTAALRGMAQGVRDLTTELRNFGKDARQVLLDDLTESLSSAEGRLPGLERRLQLERSKLDMERGKIRPDEDVVEAQGALVRSLEGRVRNLNSLITETRSNLDAQTELALRLDALEAQRERERARPAAGVKAPAFVDPATLYGDPGDLREGLAAYDAAEAQKGVIIASAAKYRMEVSAIETKNFIANTREQVQASKRAAEEMTATASQFIGIGVAGVQQLTDSIISGQDHAVERFAATMAKQVGAALIGHGINALAGGISVQALELAPVTGGTSAIVTGTGLIAAGLALGGAGTGIERAIGGVGGGGGARGSGGLGRGVNEPSLSRTGSGGEGGQVVFINNYGVYGPSAEDAAREQERMTRTGRRRGIL